MPHPDEAARMVGHLGGLPDALVDEDFQRQTLTS
jgi:hypothetical protein